jgi:N utilization substance protein B
MNSRNRRAAREWALRALYQLEVTEKPLEETLSEVLSVAHLDQENEAFVKELVSGIVRHQKGAIDPLLQRFTRDWTLDRLAVIDRNVMRLAACELLFHPATPVAVVVNEAVELVKKYSTAESGRFVNGVLGAIVDLIESGELKRGEPVHDHS